MKSNVCAHQHAAYSGSVWKCTVRMHWFMRCDSYFLNQQVLISRVFF